MVETTRTHDRIRPVDVRGVRWPIEAGLPRPVTYFIREDAPISNGKGLDVLIHFMGSDHIPIQAVSAAESHDVVAVVHLGGGSAAFERPFESERAFTRVLESIEDATTRSVLQRITGGRDERLDAASSDRPRSRDRASSDENNVTIRFDRIDLSAFSAGYGAVRAILRKNSDRIDGILLMDALHTRYVPDHRVLADGGRLDTTLLDPFLDFARKATAGEKTFVITHSEVFPGTFASTTETSDYLLSRLGIRRTPVLEWGPVGMQQLSEARSGGFRIMGFAGNSAPDHLDHLHGMSAFLPPLKNDLDY